MAMEQQQRRRRRQPKNSQEDEVHHHHRNRLRHNKIMPTLILLITVLVCSSSSNIIADAYVLPILPLSSSISRARARTGRKIATDTRIKSTTSIEISNSNNKKKHQQLLQRRLAAKDYIQKIATTKDINKQQLNKNKSSSNSIKNRRKMRTGDADAAVSSATKTTSGAAAASSTLSSYQVLLDHDLLSKAEEYDLGIQIQTSNAVQKKIDSIIERNKKEEHEQQQKEQEQLLQLPSIRRNELLEENYNTKKKKKVKFQKRKMREEKQRDQRRKMMELYNNDNYNNNSKNNNNNNNAMSMEEELEELLISRRTTCTIDTGGGRGRGVLQEDSMGYHDDDDNDNGNNNNILDDDSMMMMEELGMTMYDIIDSNQVRNEKDENKDVEIDMDTDEMYKGEEELIKVGDYYDKNDDDHEPSSLKNDSKKINISTDNSDPRTPTMEGGRRRRRSTMQRQQQPLSQIGEQFDDIAMYVTDDEIVHELGLPGGRKELTTILLNGSIAKQKMIKSNIRLVTSIAKKWYRGAARQNDNNNHQKKDPSSLYGGSWSIPSLDEALQQGIIGLSQAAARFEPERNLKFSTYATYYITNEIRQLFLSTKTGCLYVPQHYFNIRNKYQKLVQESYREQTTSNNDDDDEAEASSSVLDLHTASAKLNIKNPERLQFILTSTESLLQLDAPITSSTGGSSGGNQGTNNAGGGGGDATITYSEMLECDEPTAESVVERSLLRQCIENALAAELSPHERDIVRLRHGLDDGVSRTIKQIRESYYGSGNNKNKSDQPKISLAYIRTVEKSAYRKLRFPYSVHNARLRDFAPKYAGISPDRIETKALYETHNKVNNFQQNTTRFF